MYCFYDPELAELSLGTYSVLKQVELCRQTGRRYLYLGYYVALSPHMSYKAKFHPHERLIGGRWREAMAHDAQDRGLVARYGMIERDGHTEAVIEMSAASGLALVSDRPLDPRRASTRGTGDMMLDAMQHGAKRILLGIGGSATNDGGCGMAASLGSGGGDAGKAAGDP